MEEDPDDYRKEGLDQILFHQNVSTLEFKMALENHGAVQFPEAGEGTGIILGRTFDYWKEDGVREEE